jgi:uncharacterized protein YigE (DUF2233 family)
MRALICLVAGAMLLTACEQQPAGEPVVRMQLDGTPVAGKQVPAAEAIPADQAASLSACQSASFEGVPLTHCIADPALHTIGTALAPSQGDTFGTIASWAAGKNESRIAFVMNAGMYGDDLKPIGYFVQGSERLTELDRGTGTGNFYLQPNGVFFGSNGTWRILPSEVFLRTVGDRPQFGTQSGPMLVINGELHPEISENGASRALRNGVGIAEDGKAHFVISDAPLSFGQLARFYRDVLKVPDALLLDGNISSLFDPATGRMDNRRVGPLIVVEKK